MPPSPTTNPRQRLVFLEDENDGTPALAEAGGKTPTAGQLMDEATAAAVQETRLAFFAAWDAGAANRIKQGQLLLEAQEQLAKYGTGTFNAMLVAPRPDGFGFKSPTSAYDLMAEAKGKPKRSHKSKKPEGSTKGSTPGRSNEPAPPLPLNLEGALAPTEQAELPHGLPVTLDTSHTHVYVPFPVKGVYVPKEHLAGFTAWLWSFSNAALSGQFLTWYQSANPSRQEESNAKNPAIL